MSSDLRWRNYNLWDGERAAQMWTHLLGSSKRDVLYVLGMGFDERMCLGLEMVLGAGGGGRRDVAVLTFDEGPESSSQRHADLRAANQGRLDALAKAHAGCTVSERRVQLISDEGRRVGGRNAAKVFMGSKDLEQYTDVVVDISALPRGLYLPLLAKLLTIFDDPAMANRNLHVIVAHSAALDAATQDEGIDDDATYLHGFSAADFELEATTEQPRVWLPVLGTGQRAQLERIHELVRPDEICPVLPSPSANPREGDDLVLEYRDLLFDQLRVEMRNIIYASEANPFEVYRQIMRSIRQYQRALHPLSGCKIVASAMSSKLSSMGVLLAAYELNASTGDDHMDVGIAHVEAQGYAVNQGASPGAAATVYSLWLSGECYGR